MSLLLLPQRRERLSYARHMRSYLIILGGPCAMGQLDGEATKSGSTGWVLIPLPRN